MRILWNIAAHFMVLKRRQVFGCGSHIIASRPNWAQRRDGQVASEEKEIDSPLEISRAAWNSGHSLKNVCKFADEGI